MTLMQLVSVIAQSETWYNLRGIIPANYSQSSSCFYLIRSRTGLVYPSWVVCFNCNYFKQAVDKSSKQQVARFWGSELSAVHSDIKQDFLILAHSVVDVALHAIRFKYVFGVFTAWCQSTVLYPFSPYCSVTSLTAYTVYHGLPTLSRNKEGYSWPVWLCKTQRNSSHAASSSKISWTCPVQVFHEEILLHVLAQSVLYLLCFYRYLMFCLFLDKLYHLNHCFRAGTR